jgi:hypothetical protein
LLILIVFLLADLLSNAIDVAATLSQVRDTWSEEDCLELYSVAQRVISAMQKEHAFSQVEMEEDASEQLDDGLLLSLLLFSTLYDPSQVAEENHRSKEVLLTLIKTSQTYPKELAIPLRASSDFLQRDDGDLSLWL